MKNFKKVLALVLVLATLMGFATVAGAAYKDADQISGDYTEAIQVLELIETMEGYPDGTFGPKKTITREEAAKLIAIFDNKDSDISTYYTSINPFADEKGRWGESYVGYGYRAGIIAGMNATTFAPTANVTGTQFLKMALVTLGYDQEAEGFVGSSWAVNVLALAKKLDLIDGLADGWKPEADLTREEAAQILLNTLKADTVEYAQEAKQVGFKPTAKATNDGYTYTWNGRIYLTVAGAVSTGKELYKSFGLKVSTSYDAFYRPYTKWTKGNDSVEVMEAPKATFTTRFSMCDLLAELGVKKTDTDTTIVIDNVFCDGLADEDCGFLSHNRDSYTLAANADAFEVRPSGNKYTTISTANFGIWAHDKSTCAAPSAAKHGAQGTLTQVFYNGKDAEGNKHYYVTSIETWLAKVASVTTKTTSRDDHVKSDGAVTLKEVYLQGNDATATAAAKDETYNFESYCDDDTAHDAALEGIIKDGKLTYDDPDGIAKDDYVLLTYSFKSGKVESLDVVEGKDGRLNGYKYDTVAENPSQTRVDGEYIKDSVHFHLGYNISKSDDFGTYTFFYDAYGNVIGMKESEDTSGWGVIDRLWVTFENKGETIVNVDHVGLDAKTTTSTIKGLANVDAYKYDNDYAYTVAVNWTRWTNGESYRDFNNYYDHLFKFSADSEGKYTWNADRSDVRTLGDLNNKNTTVKVSNENAYLEVVTKDQSEPTYITVTSNTQFLVHMMDGSYTSFTGYKNAKAMLAHYVEYVMDEDNKAAEVVYLTNDVYTTDTKFVAYVGKSADQYGLELHVDGEVYYGLVGYVNGEEKTVYVDRNTMLGYFDADTDADNNKFTAGFYEFQYVTVDGDEIVRVTKGVADGLEDLDNYMVTAQKLSFYNGTVLNLVNRNKTITITDDCAVYGIWKNKVVPTTTEEILAKYQDTVESSNYRDVFVELNDKDQAVAIYIVLADNE